MKGFTGIRDLDLKILSELDDRSLLNICLTNRYLNNLCKDENFWRQKSQEKFLFYLDEKKEDETWRHFYSFQYQKETVLLGDLVIGKYEDSPWYSEEYQSSPDTDYFHDQFDNWIMHDKESRYHSNLRYIYKSSLQKTNQEENFRIVIYSTFDKYSLSPVFQIFHDTPTQSESSQSKPLEEIDSILSMFEDLEKLDKEKEQFFANKNKLFYMSYLPKDKKEAQLDFDGIVTRKIQPFLKEIEEKLQQKELHMEDVD